MARADRIPVEDLRCDGCLSDPVSPACRECRHGFRACAAQKKVTWCFQCPEFPCRPLEDFSKIHQVNGIWHHRKVVADLPFLKDHGIVPWLGRQEREGACSGCGKMLSGYARQCPRCGLPTGRK